MTKREGEHEIPSMDALEAAARRDREQAEELLAGFDRPGRRPRRRRGDDFVSHYRGGAAGEAAEPEIPPAPPSSARRVDPPTVVIPRKRGVAPWLPRISVAALMLGFGAFVAFVATGDDEPRGARNVASPSPTAMTTITNASRGPTRVDDVPLPDPPAPDAEQLGSVVAPPALPVAPRAAPSMSPGATPRPEATTAPRKPALRDDFIRDF